MPKQFRVVDLPEGSTAQEIEDALNEMADAGYYVLRMTMNDPPGLAVRAVCCLRAKRD